jgi:hypothetical protein
VLELLLLARPPWASRTLGDGTGDCTRDSLDNAHVFATLVLFLYSVCRIGLIVLIFYSFKAMPAGVYESVDWTAYFPHFS